MPRSLPGRGGSSSMSTLSRVARAPFAFGFPVLICAMPSASASHVTRNWLGATSGNWFDQTRWDAAPLPNNGNGGLTYHAVVAAAGAPYAVDVNAPVTLDALTLDAPA